MKRFIKRRRPNLFADPQTDFLKEELINALHNLNADQELVDIISGWGTEFTEEEVYNYLKDWNNRCQKT